MTSTKRLTAPAAERNQPTVDIQRFALPWEHEDVIPEVVTAKRATAYLERSVRWPLAEDGTVDRSATLFRLALRFADDINQHALLTERAGWDVNFVTEESFADVLRKWDVSKVGNKYGGRRDGTLQYKIIARKALDKVGGDRVREDYDHHRALCDCGAGPGECQHYHIGLRYQNLTCDYRSKSSEVRSSPGPFKAPSSLREVNAAKLQARGVAKPLESLPVLGVDGVAIRGWSHILAASPKAGKTELLAELCRQWRTSGDKVLYITEEPESVWQTRLAKSPGQWKHVVLLFAAGASHADLLARIQSGDETVVVIDTIRSVLGLEDESDNSAVSRSLLPFINTCRNGTQTLFFAHHLRKSGGEYGLAITGAHAFLGVVDVALELKRVNSKTPTRRLLTGYARVVDVPEIVFDRKDNGSFRLLGVGGLGELTLDTVRKRVGKALSKSWKTTKQVWAGLAEPRPSLSQVSKALTAQAKKKRAERKPPISEGSKRGATYKWRRRTT